MKYFLFTLVLLFFLDGAVGSDDTEPSFTYPLADGKGVFFGESFSSSKSQWKPSNGRNVIGRWLIEETTAPFRINGEKGLVAKLPEPDRSVPENIGEYGSKKVEEELRQAELEESDEVETELEGNSTFVAATAKLKLPLSLQSMPEVSFQYEVRFQRTGSCSAPLLKILGKHDATPSKLNKSNYLLGFGPSQCNGMVTLNLTILSPNTGTVYQLVSPISIPHDSFTHLYKLRLITRKRYTEFELFHNHEKVLKGDLSPQSPLFGLEDEEKREKNWGISEMTALGVVFNQSTKAVFLNNFLISSNQEILDHWADNWSIKNAFELSKKRKLSEPEPKTVDDQLSDLVASIKTWIHQPGGTVSSIVEAFVPYLDPLLSSDVLRWATITFAGVLAVLFIKSLFAIITAKELNEEDAVAEYKRLLQIEHELKSKLSKQKVE